MQLRLTGRSRRLARWVFPAALLALTPKCILCLLAYVGLGAVLGIRAPELCGATSGPRDMGWLWIAVPGAAMGFAGWACVARRRRGPGRSSGSFS